MPNRPPDSSSRIGVRDKLRWYDEGDTPVIPGEQRETRNPGGITRGMCFYCLDASFRWHDDQKHSRRFYS